MELIMKIIKYIFLFTILVNLNAQTIIFNDDSTAAAIENNRIYFPFLNNGILADTDGISLDNLMKYDDKGVLFFGGFFLSGYSETTLWANGIASSSLIQDYQAGKVGDNPEDSDNIIYVVRPSDTSFGEEWQNWETAVEQGAYFYDGDNDGIYNPVDKNGNGQWDLDEDKPDILYDASLFTVYNDGVPASERRWNTVDPLGLEMRQTVFVSNRNTILDDVVFVRYSILYKGFGNPSEPDSLTDVIFSIGSDCDIGGTTSAASDDLSGSDTLLQSGFTYNDSTDMDFGIDPPSVFKTIVQGPLVKSNSQNDIGYNKMGPDLGEQIFRGYKNSKINSFVAFVSGDPMIDYPNNITEVRNFMMGLIGLNGDEINPCSWYFSDVMGDVVCSEVDPFFWYSGDPVTDQGWLNNSPQDQRDLTSTGKFTLRKNEPMDIIVAYTVGRGTDHLNSITVARETVEYIHEEYERNFSTIVGVEEEEKELLPSSFTLYQNYPNPFNPSTRIKYQVASTAKVNLIVYDILGREIATLVNEIKPVGTHEVEFDASELPSGIFFYRLQSGNFTLTKKMMVIK